MCAGPLEPSYFIKIVFKCDLIRALKTYLIQFNPKLVKTTFLAMNKISLTDKLINENEGN